MVCESDLFWYITSYIAYKLLKWALEIAHLCRKWDRTIFYTSEPVLLMVYKNDIFWYITANIQYEILKWALKTAHLSQKGARTIFSTSDPIFIDGPWKWSILIYHNQYGIWNFEINSKRLNIALMNWKRASNIF